MKYNITEDHQLFMDHANDNFTAWEETGLMMQFLENPEIKIHEAYMMGRLAQKKASQEVINTVVELSDDLLSICQELYELLPEGEDKLRMSRKIIAAGLKPLQSPTYVPFKTARKDNVIPIR